MYPHEKEVQELLSRLSSKFPNSTIIFDAYSNMTVKHINGQSSLRKTGATISWGVDNPMGIEKNPELNYEKMVYLTDVKYTSSLNLGYRTMFRFVGKFQIAKEAHRILIFSTK